LGMVTVIPYGLRAFALHRSLSASPPHHTRTPSTLVSLARAIPYGPGPRNAIDIYLPCGPGMHDMHDEDNDREHVDMHPVKRPVMLFVHGGVWAAGERFHYAPMAVRCAQAGIISAVISYTLYPEAKVPTMVGEVEAALDWTLDNISRYGGDPSRIILVGHSAGAQLSALTLIQSSISGFTTNSKGMPCAFVGMAGVYNIKEHYQYEKGRF
jgi:acetyl esterase/lipase